jgi:hypothetical protein
MAAKHPKRPRDPNQLAKLIVELASGERTEAKPATPTPVDAATETGARRGAPALWHRTGDMALDGGNEPVDRARH